MALTDSALAINGGLPVRSPEQPWPPWPIFDETEVQALTNLVRSGNWWFGEQKEAFTREFTNYQQARFGVAVTNGTVAIQVALMACGIGCGDEVIVPPYTFIATASACVAVNAVPVFADIEPDTYCISPDAVQAAITPKTKAIIGVHLGGCPIDFDRILPIARRHGLKLIEDACHGWGVEWKGQRVGAIGDAGVFSFQASKNLNAGEGGIMLTNDESIYQAAWSLHNCGRVQDGAWYQHDTLGGNYRMTEWQAAILRSQLKRLDEQQDLRNTNAHYLDERLQDIEGIEPQRRDERVTRHGYHLYIMRYAASKFGGLPREEFIQAVQAEGIPLGAGYTRPLYAEAAFRTDAQGQLVGSPWAIPMGRRYEEVSCPVCERACREEGLWLGQSALLGGRQDMDDIVKAIGKVAHAARR